MIIEHAHLSAYDNNRAAFIKTKSKIKKRICPKK